MIDLKIIDKFIEDQAKDPADQKFTMTKTSDKTFMLYKKQYDQDTGLPLADKHVAAIPRSVVQGEINNLQASVDNLKAFLTLIKDL